MRSILLISLATAAIVAAGLPTVALAGDCEGSPDGCGGGGGPPPTLPTFSPVAASSGSYVVFPDGQNRRDGYERDGTTTYFAGGAFVPYTGTLSVGGAGSRVTLLATKTPEQTAQATASNVGGGAHSAYGDMELGYGVIIHAANQAAANALLPFLSTSGAVATASGIMILSATGQAFSQGVVHTGLTGVLDQSLQKVVYSVCDPTGYLGQTTGCGTHGYSVDVNFVTGSAFLNGSSLDFYSSLTLDASAHAGPTGLGSYEGSGSAYVDPTITLNPLLDPKLYSLYIGSSPPAAITGAVPEPASWAMMLFGFGLTGVVARRASGRNVVLA
nr:PEPxxWA-CTERM sorting domain-containing protein [Polymorphobacter sp.]